MLEKNILQELRKIVGPSWVRDEPEDLYCYAYDATFHENLPEVVVSPQQTAEVSGVMQVAYRHEIPVVARGMGSGLAGGSIPTQGGIALNLTRMNRILEIDRGNMIVTAQAGVVTADLQTAVAQVGLFYPPDPSSQRQSTLGGNIACNAGGPHCLKYGVTGDYVMGMEAVLADGRILRTGGKTIKNVVGYDLTGLFVGSEGTLGVITEALMRLIAPPQAIRTAMAVFPRLVEASVAVTRILEAGLVPVAMEIMDDTTIATIEAHKNMGLPLDVEAILILETDGDEDQAVREIERIAQICRENGAREVRVAEDREQGIQLMLARKSVSPSLARRRPNKLGEDITVPRQAIPEMVARVKEISRRFNLPIPIFGHIGDGNLHPNILFDRKDEQEFARVQQAAEAIFEAAIDLGGVLSGEHGVGTLKRDYIERNLGPVAVEVMRCIKASLDPKNILNPGKVLPSSN
ncbi:MAG: FAD-binding protein [Chloroflexia bacterium]|nr:FAD-binding protein [Chloroflexia bacterium]